MPRQAIDMVGQAYGLLTVNARAAKRHKDAAWECVCVCGGTIVVAGSSLRTGRTRSCGCLRNQGHSHPRHGHAAQKSPTYRSWVSMKNRCQCPTSAQYADYGGRGITVCERWQLFDNFLADMGLKPEGLTLDRVDNEQGYEPGNCRWATAKEQNENRRTAKKLEARVIQLEAELRRIRGS